MKLKDLKKEVCALSFITPENANVGFITSVRRALSIIFSDLRISGKKTLTVPKKSICKSEKNILHKGNESLTLPLAGRAYSIKLSGKGWFIIHDGAISRRESFDDDDVSFRGFLTSGGTVEFCGEYAYTVVSLLCFSDISSDRLTDIPLDDENFIDMSGHPDFFAFSGPPSDGSGKGIRGAVLDGAKILLPNDFCGRVTVHYRKRPKNILDDGDETVDLPHGYLPLLAPLCASFLLADDDRELSECYMALYKSMADGMKTSSANAEYVKTNGWA